MPITLIATPGAADGNAYLDVAEANAYFATRLFSTAWTAVVDDEVKKAALISATRRVDQLAFAGRRASTTQALAWPRECVVDEETETDVPRTVIPVPVKVATCEVALALLTQTSDPAATDPLAKFSALSLPGGLSLTLRDGGTTNDALPPVAWRLLARFTDGAGVVYLERS